MIIARSSGLSFINTGSGSPYLAPQFCDALADRKPAAPFRLKVILGFRSNCKNCQTRLPTVQPATNALYSTGLDGYGPQEEAISFSHNIFLEFERRLRFLRDRIDASRVVDAIGLRELHSIANWNILRCAVCTYDRVGRRSLSCLTMQGVTFRKGSLSEEVQLGTASSNRNRDLWRVGSQKDRTNMPVHDGGAEGSARDIERRRSP